MGKTTKQNITFCPAIAFRSDPTHKDIRCRFETYEEADRWLAENWEDDSGHQVLTYFDYRWWTVSKHNDELVVRGAEYKPPYDWFPLIPLLEADEDEKLEFKKKGREQIDELVRQFIQAHNSKHRE